MKKSKKQTFHDNAVEKSNSATIVYGLQMGHYGYYDKIFARICEAMSYIRKFKGAHRTFKENIASHQ